MCDRRQYTQAWLTFLRFFFASAWSATAFSETFRLGDAWEDSLVGDVEMGGLSLVWSSRVDFTGTFSFISESIMAMGAAAGTYEKVLRRVLSDAEDYACNSTWRKVLVFVWSMCRT
jgi:hypothetical protein